MTTGRILVVESLVDHREVMRQALESAGLLKVTEFADSSVAGMTWLSRFHRECAVISTNFDLGPERQEQGRTWDPGTGRDIVHYLCERTPSGAVVLHTDNFFVRPGMQQLLDEAGWQHAWVAPGNGLGWIQQEWLPLVSRLYSEFPQKPNDDGRMGTS